MERGDGPERGSDLPAPYRSPWRSLLEALQAAAADLGLRLRELLRRNRQGQLPVPGFWPDRASPLFWPLLLVLAALLLVLGISQLRGLASRQPSGSAQAPAENGGRQGAGTAAELATQPTAARPPEALPEPPDSAAPRTTTASGDRAGRAMVNRPDAADPPTASTAPGDEQAPPAEPLLQLDPLLALLADEAADGLLLDASPDPAGSLLRLTLSSEASALPRSALRQRAEQWQQRALAAGYERLELRSPEGQLLGRQALVGSGMILLDAASAS